MGNKKKRGHPDLEELLGRPWCYYCERDFDDLKILIDHQRAKHFKCDKCGRRLNTAGGLAVHLNQVHKETLTTIENALPNRSNLDVEIFGTEGIPQDVADAHRQRVLTQFAQAEAERRATTGNPVPGGTTGGDVGAKKVKVESKDDIKKRMAEFKARKAAAQQADSGADSPITPASAEVSAMSQQVPGIGAPQVAVNAYQQSFGGPNVGFQSPAQPFSPQAMPGFSPPATAPYGAQAFSPPQIYGSSTIAGFAAQAPYPGGAPPGGFPVGVPRPYGGASPPMPFGQKGQFQPPRMNTPPQIGTHGAVPQVYNISSPPGLPQRPAFGAPPVNTYVMQQMHQGQTHHQPSNINPNPQANGSAGTSVTSTPAPQTPVPTAPAEVNSAKPSKQATEPTTGKKAKKDEKGVRMVYSDNEVSPEEKMATMPKYAFERSTTIETVSIELHELAAIGVVRSGRGEAEPVEEIDLPAS